MPSQSVLERLVVELVGDDANLKRALQDAERATTSSTGRIKQTLTGVGDSLKQIGTSLPFLVGAGGLVYALQDVAKFAQNAEVGMRLFEKQLKLNNSSVAEGTRQLNAIAKELGLVPQTIADSATQLLRQGLTMQQITTLFRGAGASALALGRSTADGIDAVTQAVVNQQSIYLNYAGIAQNLNVAYQEQAKALGKTSAELTTLEKAQAAVNLVQKATAQEVASLPDLLSGYTGATNQLTQALTDAKLEMGDFVKTGLTPIVQVATTGVSAFNSLPDGIKRIGLAGAAAAVGVGVLTTAMGAFLAVAGPLFGAGGIILLAAGAVGALAAALTGSGTSLDQAFKDAKAAIGSADSKDSLSAALQAVSKEFNGDAKTAIQNYAREVRTATGDLKDLKKEANDILAKALKPLEEKRAKLAQQVQALEQAQNYQAGTGSRVMSGQQERPLIGSAIQRPGGSSVVAPPSQVLQAQLDQAKSDLAATDKELARLRAQLFGTSTTDNAGGGGGGAGSGAGSGAPEPAPQTPQNIIDAQTYLSSGFYRPASGDVAAMLQQLTSGGGNNPYWMQNLLQPAQSDIEQAGKTIGEWFIAGVKAIQQEAANQRIAGSSDAYSLNRAMQQGRLQGGQSIGGAVPNYLPPDVMATIIRQRYLDASGILQGGQSAGGLPYTALPGAGVGNSILSSLQLSTQTAETQGAVSDAGKKIGGVLRRAVGTILQLAAQEAVNGQIAAGTVGANYWDAQTSFADMIRTGTPNQRTGTAGYGKAIYSTAPTVGSFTDSLNALSGASREIYSNQKRAGDLQQKSADKFAQTVIQAGGSFAQAIISGSPGGIVSGGLGAAGSILSGIGGDIINGLSFGLAGTILSTVGSILGGLIGSGGGTRAAPTGAAFGSNRPDISNPDIALSVGSSQASLGPAISSTILDAGATFSAAATLLDRVAARFDTAVDKFAAAVTATAAKPNYATSANL